MSYVITTTHKHRIEMLINIEEAHMLDANNGNNIQRDEIIKETIDIRVAFDILEHFRLELRVHKVASGYLIFETKIDFNR